MKDIVFTIDENYVQHLCVTIASFIANNNIKDVRLFIVSPGLSRTAKQNISSTIEDKLSIEYIDINEDDFKGYYISKHISLATYYRVLLPKLLDSCIKRVVFLDSDIVILGDISPLFEIDVNGYSHAATTSNTLSRNKELGIPENEMYFNAGIMVINLDYWRQNSVSEKVIDYITHNNSKLLFWDQDALNAILYGKWTSFHPKFNFQTTMITSSIDNLQEIKEARGNPTIVHFTGSIKPWDFQSKHPFKSKYWDYIKKTPYRYAKPCNRNIKTFIIRLLPEYLVDRYVKMKNNFN